MSTRPRRSGRARPPSSPSKARRPINTVALEDDDVHHPNGIPGNSMQGHFTFEAPIVRSSNVAANDLATDKLLLKLGFALGEQDALWYHPEAVFSCVDSPSKEFCKWKRNTIYRWPVSMIGTVAEVESLIHPYCINKDWLDTLESTDAVPNVLANRFKGKSAKSTHDLSSLGVVNPSPKVGNEGPVKKRKINKINNPHTDASTSTPTPPTIEQVAPHPSVALPPASPRQTRGTKRKDPPPADALPPRPVSTILRVDVTKMPGFQNWEKTRMLSTDEKLSKANRRIEELEATVRQLQTRNEQLERGMGVPRGIERNQSDDR